MNIVHLIDSEGFYGAEIVVVNLMDAQRSAGERPVLISIGGKGVGTKPLEEEARSRGLEVIALRFRNGPNPAGMLAILRSVRTLSARVIHSHGYKSDILAGGLPKSVRRVPVVSTLHGWTSTRAFSKMRIYEWAQTLALRNVDAVTVVSRPLLEHPRLRRIGIFPMHIPNGIPPLEFPPSFFSGAFPEIAAKTRETFSIVSVGRLSAEKGYDLLIRACGRLTAKRVDWSLVLLGEGGQKTHLQDVAQREESSGRVHFAGYCPRAYGAMPSFRVFVLSSLTEGLPITLLEAMQAGVPVVASAVGEIPNLLDGGRFGRLVPPGDVDSLAEALDDVYHHPDEAYERAARARKHVLEEYGVEKTARRYGELYRTLLS